MWRARSKGLRVGARGLTLIEILISTAVFSIVSAGVYVLYTAMLNTYTRGEMRAEVQQNARVVMAQIVQDLRAVGYDPSGAVPLVDLRPNAALRAAQAACISFVAPSASGGVETSVQISYMFYPSQTTLKRRVDAWHVSPPNPNTFTGGAFQPLSQSIQSMQFTYYDADGVALPLSNQAALQFCPPASAGTTPTPPQLSYEDLRRVRRVGITLKAQASVFRAADEVYVLTSDVDLRNR